MDTNTAMLVAGLSGGVLGAVGAETEIELAADDNEVITAARTVLDRPISLNEALRTRQYRRYDHAAVEAARAGLGGLGSRAAGEAREELPRP